MSELPEELAGVESVDLSDTQALVTGSTSGVGRETALALGRLGADVVVHGRDAEAGQAVERRLSELGVESRFVEADFASVSAVDGLAETVREETSELDLLFNNAGGLFREGQLTEVGVESTFHVSHLSPYLLTAELLDHLSEGARVVTTASEAHQGATLDLERVRESEAGGWAYSHSKLANVLFAAELARRLEAADREVTSVSVHPGGIPGSGFVRFLPGPLSRVAQALERVPGVTTVAEGAAELLYAGVSPATAGESGTYFAKQAPATPTRDALSRTNAYRLWVESADLLGIEEPLAEATETALMA